jgi:hypothetical protein
MASKARVMPSMGPMLYLSRERARAAATLLLFRRTARAAAILTRGGRWSRAVTVLGLSFRPGNRHDNAVGVAAEFRAGWTIARVSAGVVAVDWRPGRCSRGQGRPGIWLCGFSPLLTAGVTSFPDRRKLSAVGGRRRPACPPGLGVLPVALRPGPGFRWQRRWSASGELMPADGSSGLPALDWKEHVHGRGLPAGL